MLKKLLLFILLGLVLSLPNRAAVSLCIDSQLNTQSKQEINAEKTFLSLTQGQNYILSFDVTSVTPAVNVTADDGSSLQSLSIVQVGFYSFNLTASSTSIVLAIQSLSGKKQLTAICIDNLLLQAVSQQVVTTTYKEPVNDYRYAYNGMEKDDMVKGLGNSYTTQYRQYDSRLGRWLSLDPLMSMFPSQSPYLGMGNNPVFFNDPLGLAPEGGKRGPPHEPGTMPNRQDRRMHKGKHYFTWGKHYHVTRILGKTFRKQERVFHSGRPPDNRQYVLERAQKTLYWEDYAEYEMKMEDHHGTRVPVFYVTHKPLYKYSQTEHPDEFSEKNEFEVEQRSITSLNLTDFNAQRIDPSVGVLHNYEPEVMVEDPDWGMVYKTQHDETTREVTALTPVNIADLATGNIAAIKNRFLNQSWGSYSVTRDELYVYRTKRFLFFRYRIPSSKRRVRIKPFGITPRMKKKKWEE